MSKRMSDSSISEESDYCESDSMDSLMFYENYESSESSDEMSNEDISDVIDYEFNDSIDLIDSDSSEDIDRFITEFETQYGSRHPVFYSGTYGQALNEAKRELKFLLVYLHSDSHQDSQDFCHNILTNNQLIEFINQNNLLFWSCSVTYSEGYRVSQSLRESTYPYLALIGLKHNRMVLIRKFEGKQNLDSLLNQLRKSIEDNESSLIAARLEREERNMNQLIRTGKGKKEKRRKK
jgi:hypothetical protein